MQILLNLIGNSIKFTYKGKVILDISIQDCSFHNYSHRKVVFSVQDTGIGIEENQIPEVFKLFKKIEQNNQNINNKSGIGLGIPISQNLALIMHEEGIQVQSRKNVGSNFSFSIPLVFSDKNSSNDSLDFSSLEIENLSENTKNIENTIIPYTRSVDEQQLKELKNYQNLKNFRVLIVDDDMMNIFIHKNYLESIGVEYEEAFNGLEAIQKIQNRAESNQFFDIILLDCNMPILDGFQAAEKIRNLVEKKKIPYVAIVALTANATISDLSHCQKCGMEYFLGKPVSFKRFKNKMLEIMNKLK